MTCLKKISLILGFSCFFASFSNSSEIFGINLVIGKKDLTSSLKALADPSAQIDSTKITYSLRNDYTYDYTLEMQATVLTADGISQLQNTSQNFFPDSQKMEVAEAYVIHADGTKLPVTPENIFTRPSAATQSAPGFMSSLTTTVVFPQLRVGSHTYILWKKSQFKPTVLGFAPIFSPPFTVEIKNLQVLLTLPKTLKLDWKERGGFTVQDMTQGDTRTIKAEIKNVPPHTPQYSMPNPLDFSPVFIVSNIPTWEEIGSHVFKESTNTAEVTPQIKELSHTIVQDKKGKEAAEAIYNWMAENIQYIPVQLNAQQGYTAHSPEEILKNGYGDCKDHVALMRALLKAQNIESFPVLVNQGPLFTPLPLPYPNQFNHELIYLPEFDLFANPSNPFASFGTLGIGLDGKFVVVASPKGKTTHLPSFTPQQNIYKNTNLISILPDGTIEGKNTLTATGEANTIIRQAFAKASSLQNLSEKFLNQTDNGGYGNFTLSGNPFDLTTPFSASGTWTSPNSFSMGKTVYFWVPIGLDPISPHAIRTVITPQARLYPFIISPVQYIWTYEIIIPKGYSMTRLPPNVAAEIPEGSYKSKYTKKGEKVFVERSLTINNFYLSPKEYESLRSILYKLESDARSILVMQKKK